MPIILFLLLLLAADQAWAAGPDEASLRHYPSTEQVRADVEAAYRDSPPGEIDGRTAGRYLVLAGVLEASGGGKFGPKSFEQRAPARARQLREGYLQAYAAVREGKWPASRFSLLRAAFWGLAVAAAGTAVDLAFGMFVFALPALALGGAVAILLAYAWQRSLWANIRGQIPSGLLRVACPTALSHMYVMPLVPRFLQRYPDLELDLQISDRFVNLLDEGAELAIRIGHLDSSSLRARRIGSFKRACVASTDYLERRGTPQVPSDLKHHDCVIYTLLASGATWRFKDEEIPVSGRIRVNSPEASRESVRAGLGIGQGPAGLFEDGLRSGNLQIVLEEFSAPPVPMQIVYAANRLVSKRAIVFMDFITEEFARIPQLNT
nr:substrate binding domain-containing protein [uncultured Pseudoxanthomonas sp.]